MDFAPRKAAAHDVLLIQSCLANYSIVLKAQSLYSRYNLFQLFKFPNSKKILKYKVFKEQMRPSLGDRLN